MVNGVAPVSLVSPMPQERKTSREKMGHRSGCLCPPGRRSAKQVGRKWCTDRVACVPHGRRKEKHNCGREKHIGITVSPRSQCRAGGVGLANSPRFQIL